MSVKSNNGKKPFHKELKKKKNSKTKANWIHFFIVLVTLPILLYIRLRFVDIPLDRDEGTYLHLGNMVLNGQIPFVDFYEYKPPGMFVTYGLFHLLFGSSLISLHIGLLILILTIMYLVYGVALDIFKDNLVAVISGIALGYFSLNIYMLGFAILSEYFLMLFCVWSFWLLIKGIDKESSKWILFSGLALGWGFTIRQHAAFYALPIGIYFLIHYRKDFKILLQKSLYFAGGILIPIVLVLAWVLISGGGEEMYYWMIDRPSNTYTKVISWERGQTYLSHYANVIFKNQILLFTFSGLGGLLLWFSKITFNKKLFLSLFMLFTFASIFPGNRFYGHYWLNLLPALSLLFAVPFYFFLSNIKLKGGMSYFIISIVFLVGIIIQVTNNKKLYFDIPPNQMIKSMYGENPNIEIRELTDYLAENLKEGEDVYMFGSEPQVYYQLDLIPKTNHIFLTMIHEPVQRNSVFQQEVIDYLNSDPPEYIIHVQNKYSIGMNEGTDQRLYQMIYYFEQSDYYPIAFADIINPARTDYFYGNDAQINKPKSDNFIYLYQKR